MRYVRYNGRLVPVRRNPIKRKGMSGGTSAALITALAAGGVAAAAGVWYFTQSSLGPPSSGYVCGPDSPCPDGYECEDSLCVPVDPCPGIIMTASTLTIPANGAVTLSVTGATGNPVVTFYIIPPGSSTAVVLGTTTASNDGYAQYTWVPTTTNPVGTYLAYAATASCSQTNTVSINLICAAGTCPPGCPCPAGQDCVNGFCTCPTGFCGANCPCPANYQCGSDGTCQCENCVNCACPTGYQCAVAPGSIPLQGTCVPITCPPGSCSSSCPCGAGETCSGSTCVCPSGGSCHDGCSCPAGQECSDGICTTSTCHGVGQACGPGNPACPANCTCALINKAYNLYHCVEYASPAITMASV